MTDETKKPVPGTWGALVRSETPMPWRRYLQELTFTPDEWRNRGPGGTLVRIIRRAGEIVAEKP